MTIECEQSIYPFHVNKVAIIDKAVISSNGNLNTTFRDEELADVVSKSIYRNDGLYAACIFANWPLTDNPLSIHHGKTKRFKNVPALRFTMRSENSPITCAQTVLLIKKCTQDFTRVTNSLSSVELTFDVTGTTVKYIRRHLIEPKQARWF